MGTTVDVQRLHLINREKAWIAKTIEDLRLDASLLDAEAAEISKSASQRLSLIVTEVMRHASSCYDTVSYSLVAQFNEPSWAFETQTVSILYTLYYMHEKHVQDFRIASSFRLFIPLSWLELDEGMLAASVKMAAVGSHKDFYDWLSKYL